MPLPIRDESHPQIPDNKKKRNQPIVAVTCFFCWCQERTGNTCNEGACAKSCTKVESSEGSLSESRVRETRDTSCVLVDRGSEQPGALTYGQPCADFFPALYTMVAQGDILRFPLFLFLFFLSRIVHDEEARGAARSSLRFLPVSLPIHVHLSRLFLSSFSLSRNALLILAGRKSRNRPAGNPLLVRSISSPPEEGSARSIGVSVMVPLTRHARVSHIRIHFTLGCGSL